MEKSKTMTDPQVPLPDPDKVERVFAAVLQQIKERRRFYTGLGVAALAVLVTVIVILNLNPGRNDSAFVPLWRYFGEARGRLERDLTAREEIARLESQLEELRGDPVEGLGLWLAAIVRYREAWLTENVTFGDRRPHLEKARDYLKELRAERFDGLLLAKTSWFSTSGAPPIEHLLRQVKADLAWAAEHTYTEPETDPSLLAVLRTEIGDIHLRFYSDLAPKHVDSFVTLARAGCYNGTAFHFVYGGTASPASVMGGDPYTFFYNDPLNESHILRWGTGGVGYGLPPEEARFRVNHRRGVVTSQRVEKADWDNAVQFQIMVDTETAHDRIHTPFAKVAEGMAVVDEIARRKTAANHDAYKDDRDFQRITARDLLVDPVLIHKVIVYKDRRALEHSFPLAAGEKRVSSLKDSPVQPLSEDELQKGRELRRNDAKEDRKPGTLYVPFPKGVEDGKPQGDRRVLDREEKEIDGSAGQKDPPAKGSPAKDASEGDGARKETPGG